MARHAAPIFFEDAKTGIDRPLAGLSTLEHKNIERTRLQDAVEWIEGG
jgi:hypothetical protein